MPNLLYYKRFLFLLLTLMLSLSVHSAPLNKNLWLKWTINNPLSTETISHEKWQFFLDKTISTNNEGLNLLDYSHIKPELKAVLNEYVNSMSQINIENYNRKEQLAYWINLYNALVVKTIVEFYPIGTIEDISISPGLFSIGPWGKKIVTVNNTLLSLDDIQHRIIRPVWNDPRTLYATNNSSVGGPNLAKTAYQASRIEEQLNDAASDYINSLRAVQVIEGELILSKIYDWYIDDFGGNKDDLITHLKRYAKQPLLDQIKHANQVDSYIYNWHLNEKI